ncbi:MAG TPA: hypothetical protein VK034_08510 [Enhygromyxa sp.]|nr:hypothetical protein [Enhygromyxa sp.]
MNKLGLSVGVLALLLSGACTNDDNPPTSGTETETGDGDGDPGDGDPGDGDGDQCTPAGVYGDCGNGGLEACMADSLPLCLTDNPNQPSIGVCGRRCDDECDCWAQPADGEAPVACKALVAGDPDRTCVLDCSGGQSCPGGMTCLDALGICVFSVN